MLISTPPRKKSSLPAPNVAQLTKTTRASTKTFSLILTLMWPKSMTRHTRAVGVTRRWPMRMMAKAARMRERRSPRRRRSKQQSDGQAKRDLERVSESALRRRWGTWMPGKFWKPHSHLFRIMRYEYLVGESNSKQRQSKMPTPKAALGSNSRDL